MDIRKIKKLIDLMIESDLQAIEVKEGDQSIALTRRSPVVAAGIAAMPAPSAEIPSAPKYIVTGKDRKSTRLNSSH